MKTMTYHGRTIKEALIRVRRDLGGSALILETKRVRRRRWFGNRDGVEVVVAEDRQGAGPGKAETRPISIPINRTSGRPSSRSADPVDAPNLNRAGGERAASQPRLDRSRGELPLEWVSSFGRLLDLAVPERIARRIIEVASETIGSDERDHPEAIQMVLQQAVATGFPTAPPAPAIPGCRRTIALIGSTGVGKTSTVAKLAAEAKLRQGLRVGMMTLDTYRIAAIEQLRIYAEMIDLPMSVAETPERVPSAIDELGEVDLIVIDTAGRNPRDQSKIEELGTLLHAARPDEIHLTLSATIGERSLITAVERFELVGFDRLIITKLDEGVGSVGALLSVVARAARPISYLTNGQRVPDDIEPADALRLARLLLDQEFLDSRPGFNESGA